jgi:UDPglucose 6-dehydrogenase
MVVELGDLLLELAVIGLGKLGLPLAALLASGGNRVKGFDALEHVRSSIRSKSINSNEPGLQELINDQASSLQIVDDISLAIQGAEAVFIIVPTPSLPSGHFSNEYLLDVVEKIGKSIEEGQKIVVDIVSTVMPGSCDGPIREKLESSSGVKIGSQIGLCYNPEFIALGSVIKDMQYPDMHLIGQSSDWAGATIEAALKSMVKRPVPARRMNLKEAELVKIAVNNYVTMKISYANLLMQGSILLGGVDIDVVTDAIGLDSRIGNKYLKAAAAYGGPCFPRDTRALTALYEDLGLVGSLSLATQVINESHTRFISNRIASALEKGAKIGVLGLSYKTGTTVTEESTGLAIANELAALGFTIEVWDDEGATISDGMENKVMKVAKSESELIDSVDYIVISRLLKDPLQTAKLLRESNKPFMDLWRQL